MKRDNKKKQEYTHKYPIERERPNTKNRKNRNKAKIRQKGRFCPRLPKYSDRK
jgi:hypothetical protein